MPLLADALIGRILDWTTVQSSSWMHSNIPSWYVYVITYPLPTFSTRWANHFDVITDFVQNPFNKKHDHHHRLLYTSLNP